MGAVLRCKVKSFVDGGVIGGKDFVSGVMESLKGEYLKEDRKSGASRLLWRRSSKGGGEGESRTTLWSMRRIQKE